LCLTAENKKVNILKLLIATGIDFNTKDLFGFTVLHLVRDKENLYILQFLLTKGLNVNASSNDGFIPLNIMQFLQILLENGGYENNNDRGCSPLGPALARGDLAIGGLLITYEANVNVKQENGESLLILVFLF
jgi:ankyrin repeat protein